MNMRVSNYSRFSGAVQSLQDRQSELSKAQMQLTSGKRISTPSDDPTGAARVERAYTQQQRIVAEQRSVGLSRASVSQIESSLGQVGDMLQQARESVAAAGNGSYSAAERHALASHLKQIRSELMSVANQPDGAGGYLFGGQGANSLPFLDQTTGVQFAGTGGVGQLSSTEEMPTSVDGKALWLSINSGNGVFETDGARDATTGKYTNLGSGYIAEGGVVDPSALTGGTYDITFSVAGGVTSYSVAPSGQSGTYTSGQTITVDGMALKFGGQPADGDMFTVKPATSTLDPFEALDKAIAVLDDPSANSGAVGQAVSNGVRDLDQAITHFQGARSVAGATLTRLDSIDTRNQDRDLWAKSVQSDVEDLDMVQAISDFQNKQTSYQAALQSYSMVQRMSLFDYLK